MKVLFVTMQYGRSYRQGTERYLATLGDCLRARGHEVCYLAGDPLGVDRRYRVGDTVAGTEGLFALPGRGWMAVCGDRSGRLRGFLKDARPDLVHLANPAHVGVGVAEHCRPLGIPVVITTMDFWWVCPKATLLRADGGICDGSPGWRECTRCIAAGHPSPRVQVLGRLPRAASGLALAAFCTRSAARGLSVPDCFRWGRRRAVLGRTLAQAAQVIFPSRATAEAIGPRLGHERFRIIPYGLAPEWFAEPRPRAAKAPEDLTIGYAGALLPHKGPHLLLQAVHRLGWTRTHVRIAGTGDEAYEAALRRDAGGLRVEFLGGVPAEDMPAFLRSLDVLVMPSVWPENLPFVVLEAHASGVPVIASRLAGIADQIGDDELMFEPGSAGGLAAVLHSAAGRLDAMTPGRVLTADEMTARTLEVYGLARAP